MSMSKVTRTGTSRPGLVSDTVRQSFGHGEDCQHLHTPSVRSSGQVFGQLRGTRRVAVEDVQPVAAPPDRTADLSDRKRTAGTGAIQLSGPPVGMSDRATAPDGSPSRVSDPASALSDRARTAGTWKIAAEGHSTPVLTPPTTAVPRSKTLAAHGHRKNPWAGPFPVCRAQCSPGRGR
jgi:hypothetical protein